MKKVISLLVAIMMLCVIFTGCSNKGPVATDDNGKTEVSENAEVQESAEVSESEAAGEVSTGISSTGNPVADSYTAYTNAKYVVINKLSDGLEQDTNALSAYWTIIGVSMADLSLAPIAAFGYDAATVEASMAYLGAAGVKYTINGNTYTMTYTDADGQAMVYTATYDPGTDSMVMSVTTNGVEGVYSEYHKTSFGYVSQSFFANDDGTGTLYQFSISGEDGVFGSSSTPVKPAALTGSEPATFPQSCDEWYAVTGYTITGQTADGTAISFEYTPTPSEG